MTGTWHKTCIFLSLFLFVGHEFFLRNLISSSPRDQTDFVCDCLRAYLELCTSFGWICSLYFPGQPRAHLVPSLSCMTDSGLVGCCAKQGYATASYSEHSLLATIGVVRSIVAAALQPAFAKTSDLFGRNAVLIFSVIVYAMGSWSRKSRKPFSFTH